MQNPREKIHMKIAQVAPLYESVPPKTYGGTERVVSYLTEELVNKGHEVTLFAPGDSVTRARLIPGCKRSLRTSSDCVDQLAHHITMLQRVQDMINTFDIVHYHIDYLHFPLSAKSQKLHLTTLHGRLDIPDLKGVYNFFPSIPVVSISNNQRLPLANINWAGTVYHGLPRHLYDYYPDEGEYLAFLGRISPEKRVDRAIEIAKRTGIKLKIAAKVDKVDEQYFKEKIEHLLSDPVVEFIGEIGEEEKKAFLGNAKALLFPIDWPEPFGMVMIEALACGTPVVAFRNGSVPEIIRNGITGFIVNNVEEAVKAVDNIRHVSRRDCRTDFELRFSSSRMAEDYLRLYALQINKALTGKKKATYS